MAVSKVILNGTTLIDVTDDTVASNNLLSGEQATGADGQKVQGAYVPETYSSQAKTGIVPTESSQTITPDTGYDGLSSVQINGISSTYVGSAIERRDETDLTASGATVIVPAGYYAENESKSVASGSAATPATAITANPTISVNSAGLITATASATESVTPSVTAGYVSSGTAGNITVSGSATQQLSTQAATTITPTESEQTVVAAGKYTTGIVKVGAISSTYVGSEIERRDETDLTASGATVSVPAGYYAENETKSVAMGVAGTPTATKSTVSNHSVSVTPTVTNTTGYITGSTKTGTAITVNASELVSGSQIVSQNGTVDVTNLAEVVVDVPIAHISPAKTVIPTAATQVIEPDINPEAGTPVSTIAVGSQGNISGGVYENWRFEITGYEQGKQYYINGEFEAPDGTKVVIDGYMTYDASWDSNRGGGDLTSITTKTGPSASIIDMVEWSRYTYNQIYFDCTAAPPVFEVTKAVKFYAEPFSRDDGIASVTVTGDTNFVAENIKKDISIWGLTGAYEGDSEYQEKTVIPTTATQVILPDSGSSPYLTAIQSGSNATVNRTDGFGVFVTTWANIYDTYHVVGSLSLSNGSSISLDTDVALYDEITTWEQTGVTNVAQMHFMDNTFYVIFDAPENTCEITAATDIVIYALPYTPAYDALSKVTVTGDANLIPENIASGVEIFGVTGTHSGSSAVITETPLPDGGSVLEVQAIDLSQDTVTPDTLLSGFTAHDKTGTQIVGTASGGATDSHENEILMRSLSGVYSNTALTSVGPYGFAAMRSMTSAYLPNVSSIREYAFYQCAKMSSVVLDYSNISAIPTSAFNGCSSLSSFLFDDISSIGASAFAYCSQLRSVVAPVLLSLNNGAFYSCKYLSNVEMPLVSTIAYGAFEAATSSGTYAGNFSFNSVTTIGASAFKQCFIKSFYAPNLISIHSYAFNSAHGSGTTRSFILNAPLLSTITDWAFANARVELNAPNIQTIGPYAFYSAYVYPSALDLPSCTSISSNAFQGAFNTYSVNAPVLTYLAQSAFYSSPLQYISAPLLTEAYSGAFRQCAQLSEVYLPKISRIYEGMFSGCSKLSSITLSIRLSVVEPYAFAYCYLLPSTGSIYNISRIGSSAYLECSAIQSVNTYASDIGENAFNGCINLSVASLNTYRLKSGTFNRCFKLLSLYLDRFCELDAGVSSIFRSTPIFGYTASTDGVEGKVYVPSSLYSWFVTDGYWSSIASRIVSQ